MCRKRKQHIIQFFENQGFRIPPIELLLDCYWFAIRPRLDQASRAGPWGGGGGKGIECYHRLIIEIKRENTKEEVFLICFIHFSGPYLHLLYVL